MLRSVLGRVCVIKVRWRVRACVAVLGFRACACAWFRPCPASLGFPGFWTYRAGGVRGRNARVALGASLRPTDGHFVARVVRRSGPGASGGQVTHSGQGRDGAGRAGLRRRWGERVGTGRCLHGGGRSRRLFLLVF